MSHRVVQFDSIVSDEQKADDLQSSVIAHLNSKSYDVHSRAVNDGQTMDGEDTLGVNIDFNVATEANTFYDWLWQLAQDNKDSSSGFKQARIQVHDCKHLQGLQEPCEIGNANKFDLR